MRRHSIKRRIAYSIAVILLLLTTGCSSLAKKEDTPSVYYYPKDSQEQTPPTQDTEQVFLREEFQVLAVDTEQEQLTVFSMVTKKEYVFAYGLYTELLDTYGTSVSFAKLYPGEFCYLTEVDAQGRIQQMEFSSDVWRYEKITRFSVDEENGIFAIADNKYAIDENLRVFSENGQSTLGDLTDNDTLTIIGKDKRILSVVVTTGHGSLQLSNTALFEGSFLQLDTSYFVKITPDLTLELPEGQYLLSVANEGWGGSCEIEIARGKTTEVDLDAIKGEGPKYGDILFLSDTEGITVLLDGKTIALGEALHITYGKHTLEASAEGYEAWSKYLFVNSAEATITIALEEESSDSSQTTTETQSQSSQTQSQSQSENSQTTNDDYLKDYLSTLTDLIASF